MKSQSISAQETALSNDLNDTCRRVADLKLVKRAQRGDSEAFAALFHAHKKQIYSICQRMTDSTAQAEDLTQDAFLQVFRKLSTFRGDSALSTWLHRIAVNTVLLHFRKKASEAGLIGRHIEPGLIEPGLNSAAPGTWRPRQQASQYGRAHHASPGH